MLSGSPITTTSVLDGQADYDGFVAANHCQGSKDTLECLRGVPLNLVWRPRVDGDVIVQDPLVSVDKDAYAKIPVITGDADDEGTVFSFGNQNITTNEEFMGYIHFNYLLKTTPAQVAELSALYSEDSTQGSPFNTGSANQLTPEYKRLAAFQGGYNFIGARRFFLEHTSKTQNAWSYLSKRGRPTPSISAFHGSNVSSWIAPAISTDFVAADALINFINTLDPNHSASSGTKTNASSIFWPKWNPMPENPLLTLSDPDVVNVTAENFRVDAIAYLYNLLLSEAEAN